MAAERNGDLIDAMLSSRPARKTEHGSPVEADASNGSEEQAAAAEEQPSRRPARDVELKSRLEVRPIGTALGLKELAALHRKTWSMLNVEEKQVHMMLWPLAIHFGLYEIRAGQERKRPPIIGAFWARCLADAPLTLGHLYPPALFKGLYASDVWEFGGMVIEPSYQGKGLVRLMSDTAKLFLFSRRPKLIITNPVEPLYELYKQFGLKTVGTKPIEHPHAYNVKVWLMYGDFNELAKPYFM
jgi:GNAT superfamily N-acetyltransferase